MSNKYTTVIGADDVISDILAVPGYHLVSKAYENTGGGDGATITITAVGCHIKLAGFCTTAAPNLTFSAANCGLEVGPGWTVGDIDIQAANFSLILHNGATVGEITGTIAGDKSSLKGNGWGAQAEYVEIAGDDVTCEGFAIDSTGTGSSAIHIADGNGRASIRFMNIIDADSSGIYVSDPDCLLFSNIIQNNGLYGFYINSDRTRVNCNVLINGAAASIYNNAGDDNVIDSNFLKAVGVPNFLAGSEDNIYTRNRSPIGVLSDSGTGTQKTDCSEGTPVVPTDLANLVGWFDASDLPTLVDTTTAGKVEEWTDKSGGSNHAKQTTLGNKPDIIADQLKGNPIVRFDGTADYLVCDNQTSFDTTGATGFTLFAVLKVNATQLQELIRNKPLGGLGDDPGIDVQFTATDTYTVQFTDTATNYDSINSKGTVPQSTWYILTVAMDDVDCSVYEDDVDKTLATAASGTVATVTPGQQLHIGCEPAISRFLSADVAEIVMYNTRLSIADSTTIHDYLANKWGI